MEPLAWYIAGPLIGLMVPLLLVLREKQFGVSSSYRYLGSLLTKRLSYFENGKQDQWQFYFAIGLVFAGLSHALLFEGFGLITGDTVIDPTVELKGVIYSLEYWPLFVIGGVLIGFGARYANGCTAGHCIMGVSQFSIASIVASCAFFLGGLCVSRFIVPLIFHV